MPVRFTCRVLVVRTPGGKFRIKYGYHGDDCARLLVITGPRMFIPPDVEMTEEEFNRWEFETVNGTGFTYSFSRTPVDAPLVEAKKTYEDEIPRGSVKSELFWVQDEGGTKMLAVRVTSEWSRSIPDFSLTTDCEYEASQPHQVGAIRVDAVGGSESFFHSIGLHSGKDLWPRLPMEYCLDPAVLGPLQSRVASLSPERYWITLRTGEHEFDRIPGKIIADFLIEEE